MVFSTVFRPINSPDTSPFSHSFLPVFSLRLIGPFNYISIHESLLQSWCNPSWLTALKAPSIKLLTRLTILCVFTCQLRCSMCKWRNLDDFQARTSWRMTGFTLVFSPRWDSQDCTLCNWPPLVTMPTRTATPVSIHNLEQQTDGSTWHITCQERFVFVKNVRLKSDNTFSARWK